MLIDTHCHLYLPRFQEDIAAVLNRAYEAGVERIFMPAINYESLSQMEQLHHEHMRFFKMAGIHPTEINEGVTTTEEELFSRSDSRDIYGIGETGLDYYWSDEYKKQQQEHLRIHCRVAKALQKPIILHNRESTADLLDIIKEEQDGSLFGIWHCFNGSADEGKKALDLGLYLGIGGLLTFKNAGVDTTVAQLPLDKMVLETDAPYLAPSPNRGKRNEPSFIRFTAKRLAEIKEKTLPEVEEVTSATALDIFNC